MGTSSDQHPPIAVLGAGLTGLCAALTLARAGRRVAVFEAGPEVGGVIRSERHPDGWLVEAGPNSLQETHEIATLVHELGLEPVRQAAAPQAKNRYIVREGRLHPLPLKPSAFFRSDLFSLRAKARVLREFFFHPKRPRLNDLPLADFFREHFGQELLDYTLDPFVSGIYAGDAARLSARHAFPALWKAEHEHGSLLKAQRAATREKRARGEPAGPPALISFNDGLAALPRALAAALPPGSVCLNTPVTRLSPTAGAWTLDAAPAGRFGHVLACLPAPALSRLEIGAPGAPTSLSSLSHVEHPPVTSLFLGYRRTDIAHPLDGFGLLLPAVEQSPLLGVLFNSTLFPGRSPEGHVALTVMLGGARQPGLAGRPLEDQLRLVQKALAPLLGVHGEPVFVRRNHWPRAIPQYQLDHDTHLHVIAAAEHRHRGLHIGGPIRDGIGLPACLAAGRRLARAALVR